MPKRTQQSQRSQLTQRSQQSQDQDDIDITTFVNDLVVYFLGHLNSKNPFKKQDMVKDVLQDNSSIFGCVFGEANKKFQQVFGLKVHETKSKSYFIISLLNLPCKEIIKKKSEDEKTIENILLIALSLIFLNNSPLQEEKLWFHLIKLGFREGYKVGDTDIRKLIEQDFVKQLYLQKTKRNVTDATKFDYSWADRAHVEFNKIEILKMTSMLYGLNEPLSDIWPEQYAQASRTS